MDRGLLRLLDANFNRSREGLRVCEDVCRFILNDSGASSELKTLRHGVTKSLKKFPAEDLLGARDVAADGGKGFDPREKTRTGWRDLYFANLERAKEALRSLEEVSKLVKPGESAAFKKLRFKLYAHEKKITRKFQALRDPRPARRGSSRSHA